MAKMIVTKSGTFLLLSVSTFLDRPPEAIFHLHNGSVWDEVLPDELRISGKPVEAIYRAWDPDLTLHKELKPKKFKVTLTIEDEDG